jgi:phage terminase large subunit-like protein
MAPARRKKAAARPAKRGVSQKSDIRRDDAVTAYAKAVVGKTIVAGMLVRLACLRHLRDLEEQDARGLVWKPEEAQIGIDFFEQVLCLPDENEEPAADASDDADPPAGKPFRLSPFQQFIVGSLDGWWKTDGHRRFRTAYIETAKGSGKTPMAAGMGLKALVLDKGIGKQIFTAAVTEKQAGLAFTDAERMVAASPHLRELLETSVGNIAHVPSGSFIRRISSEKRGLDGKRVHMALIDEVHEHPTGIVVEKMRAGTKNRLDALIFLITNSGYDRTSACWDLHEYGRQILEGTIQNDAFFAYVCQLDPCEACYTKGVRIPSDACPDCDHWQDEGPHWLKANPNLGVSLSWSYLREQVQEAIGMPSKQNIVRRLNFCQWTEARSIWIPTDEWDACEVPAVSEGNPGKLPCAVGVDLSTKQDLSAAVIALRSDDEPDAEPGETITIETADETGAPVKRTLNLDFTVELIPFFWMPEDTLRERQRIDRIPFDVWKKDGHLRTTPGPVVDYDEIFDVLVGDLVKRYRVQEIGYDKWNATQFGTQLRDRAKLTAVEVTQGKFLSETAKLFHALVRSGRIRHAGNPVMNWCVANAEAKVDRFENIWLEKPSPRQRIDGVIAALIALHRLVSLPFRRPSVYKRRGALMWNAATGFVPIGGDGAQPA